MGFRGTLAAALGGRRRESSASTGTATTPASMDPASVQIFAHGLIAELFGTGLRLQNLRSRVSDDLHPEIEQLTDHIDKVIREIREFAFRTGTPST